MTSKLINITDKNIEPKFETPANKTLSYLNDSIQLNKDNNELNISNQIRINGCGFLKNNTKTIVTNFEYEDKVEYPNATYEGDNSFAFVVSDGYGILFFNDLVIGNQNYKAEQELRVWVSTTSSLSGKQYVVFAEANEEVIKYTEDYVADNGLAVPKERIDRTWNIVFECKEVNPEQTVSDIISNVYGSWDISKQFQLVKNKVNKYGCLWTLSDSDLEMFKNQTMDGTAILRNTYKICLGVFEFNKDQNNIWNVINKSIIGQGFILDGYQNNDYALSDNDIEGAFNEYDINNINITYKSRENTNKLILKSNKIESYNINYFNNEYNQSDPINKDFELKEYKKKPLRLASIQSEGYLFTNAALLLMDINKFKTYPNNNIPITYNMVDEEIENASISFSEDPYNTKYAFTIHKITQSDISGHQVASFFEENDIVVLAKNVDSSDADYNKFYALGFFRNNEYNGYFSPLSTTTAYTSENLSLLFSTIQWNVYNTKPFSGISIDFTNGYMFEIPSNYPYVLSFSVNKYIDIKRGKIYFYKKQLVPTIKEYIIRNNLIYINESDITPIGKIDNSYNFISSVDIDDYYFIKTSELDSFKKDKEDYFYFIEYEDDIDLKVNEIKGNLLNIKNGIIKEKFNSTESELYISNINLTNQVTYELATESVYTPYPNSSSKYKIVMSNESVDNIDYRDFINKDADVYIQAGSRIYNFDQELKGITSEANMSKDVRIKYCKDLDQNFLVYLFDKTDYTGVYFLTSNTSLFDYIFGDTDVFWYVQTYDKNNIITKNSFAITKENWLNFAKNTLVGSETWNTSITSTTTPKGCIRLAIYNTALTGINKVGDTVSGSSLYQATTFFNSDNRIDFSKSSISYSGTWMMLNFTEESDLGAESYPYRIGLFMRVV